MIFNLIDKSCQTNEIGQLHTSMCLITGGLQAIINMMTFELKVNNEIADNLMTFDIKVSNFRMIKDSFHDDLLFKGQ